MKGMERFRFGLRKIPSHDNILYRADPLDKCIPPLPRSEDLRSCIGLSPDFRSRIRYPGLCCLYPLSEISVLRDQR
jgi:hypothetical protein